MDEIKNMVAFAEQLERGDLKPEEVMQHMNETIDEVGAFQASIELAAMQFVGALIADAADGKISISDAKTYYDRWIKGVTSKVSSLLGDVANYLNQ